MNSFGIDVAVWEYDVDWANVGVEFAFAKASQGLAKDPRFEAHRSGAMTEGVPFGAYHVYDPRYSTVTPKGQAEFFWDIVKDRPGDLPLVADIEKYITGPYHGWKYWYDFLERLKTLSQKEIMIYTGYYYWRDEGGPTQKAQHDYFSQYPLWLAYYGADPDMYIPPTWALNGKTWTFWQESDHKTLDGVTNENGKPANVDYDWFNGDHAAFVERFNIIDGGPPPSKTTLSIYNDGNIKVKK